MPTTSAREVIEALRRPLSAELSLRGRRLCIYGSIDWTADEIEEMKAAAATNESITELFVTPEDLDHLTVAPLQELLEQSSKLESLNVLDGVDGTRELSNAALVEDMLYEAMLRNGNLALKRVSTIARGNDPQLLQRLLGSSSKLESLSIHTGSRPALPPETAWAIGASLRSLDLLREVNFTFDCIGGSFGLIIASLQGHPNLEELNWRGAVDAAGLIGLLTLCSTCPKIKYVSIVPSGCEEVDIAPLLHGLKFGESLQRLKIRQVSMVGGPLYIHPSSEGPRELEFWSVQFAPNSLAVLRSFVGLREMLFWDCSGDIHHHLGALPNLEKLTIVFTSDGFLANINQIVAQGPPKIIVQNFFENVIPITGQLVSDLAEGLAQRLVPMRELVLGYGRELLLGYGDDDTGSGEWEVGVLDVFTAQVLPLITDIESLSIAYRGDDGEVRRFFESLPALANLTGLEFGYVFARPESAKALLNFMKSNHTITRDVYGAVFDDSLNQVDEDLHHARRKVEFYAQLNRFGRRLLYTIPPAKAHPVGLWPYVLANIHRQEMRCLYVDAVMFEFLKKLSEPPVNLFAKSGTSRGAKRRAND